MKVPAESPSVQEPPPKDLFERPRKPPRRRTKSHGGGVRLTRQAVVLPGRRGGSRPETPLLRWNFDGGIAKNDEYGEEKFSSEDGRKSGPRVQAVVSSRKIAAGLWRLRSPEPGVNADQSVRTQEKKTSDHGSPVAAVISGLEADLDKAKSRINKLETERRSSKKKLDEFLDKLREERAMWRSIEHDKVRVIVHEMKAALSRERNKCQKLEMVNCKLVNELANVKLSARCYIEEYEKEREARELIEEVYDELAKEIKEDKVEVEALKQELIRVQEEVEEERKMLQMTEVWREERVQMKLVDAKVMLEEKYSQMIQLVADLESFLSSKANTAQSGEIKKAQLLRQVAEVKMLGRDEAQRQWNGYIGHSGVIQDDITELGETVSQAEDHGSTYSPYYGSDPSFRRDFPVGKFSRAVEDFEKQGGAETAIMEISEVNSADMRQSKKGSPVSKMWKPSPGNEDKYKNISVDGFINGGFRPYNFPGQWSSPESGNPQIIQAKKCMGWQRNGNKSSLKARLMEARMENQKIQLQDVMQQKM